MTDRKNVTVVRAAPTNPQKVETVILPKAQYERDQTERRNLRIENWFLWWATCIATMLLTLTWFVLLVTGTL